MANKSLFKSVRGKLAPQANTINHAGGIAYSLDDKHALAQLAATGCLGQTFYASPQNQLANVLSLCETVEPEFIAGTALYARQSGYMKDMPALLCAILSVKSPGLLAEVFDRVIDNPRMLRNFVQIMRSGVVGRKSLGSLPKRLVLQWLENRTDEQLFYGSVGNDPSLADVVKMVHPKPKTDSRQALYGYMIGKDFVEADLPPIVLQYIKFKRNTNPGQVDVPDVPFQMLTALPLTEKDWMRIASTASWHMTRMNLNTFLRHGVLEKKEMVSMIANRLRDPQLIGKARVFPYQLLAAYQNIQQGVPHDVREALQDAMEIAIDNVPTIDGQVYVLTDVSGSMHSPVTGYRKGATSTVRCIDVAALVAAAIKRKNVETEVIPFESKAITDFQLNPRDSVMTNAKKLSSLPAGGTNCSAPLEYLNRKKAKGDLIIYVSDNESWIDSPNYGWCGGSSTQTMKEWSEFKSRNAKAKMICIDVTPNTTTQATEREDIVNVGGFSDRVFDLIAAVSSGGTEKGHWVSVIEKIAI